MADEQTRYTAIWGCPYHHDNFKVVSFAFFMKELIQTSAIYSTKLFAVAWASKGPRVSV